MLQDLVFVPVGVSFPDHLHGAFKQCYAIYSWWHPGGEALEAAELQTLNQLWNLICCVDDDGGKRQRARERGVYIYTKEERRRAALTAEHNKAFALSRL